MESGAEMSKFSKQEIQIAISPHFMKVILSSLFFKRMFGGELGEEYSRQFQFFLCVGEPNSYIFSEIIYDSL